MASSVAPVFRPMAFVARLFVLFLLFSWSAQVNAGVVLEDGQPSRIITTELAYLRDDAGIFKLTDLLARPLRDWQQNGNQTFSQGYTDAHWWLRFDVRNARAESSRLLIELAYPVLDEVEVWVLGPDRKLEAHYQLGDKHPFAARPVQHRFFLIPLSMQPDSRRTVVLRLHSSSSMQVPLTLWEERAYYEHDQKILLAEGVFFGGIGLLVLYSFFVFVALRERMHFNYVLFVISLLVFLASLKGFSFQFIWPQATDWNDRVLMVSLASMLLWGFLFAYRLLGISVASGWLYHVVRLLIALIAVSMALSFIMDYETLMRPLIVVAALACLILLVIGIWRWHQGDHSARFYTTAWGAMLIGGVILALNKFELLPKNFFTENAMQIGVVLEVILLSLAIVDRINEDRRKQFEAQQEVLAGERRMREVQFKALVSEREAKELLEQRVNERTAALRAANQKLEELSTSDQLTGLRNRRYLDRLLQEECCRCYRYRHPLAVLLLDIDHFKKVNDCFGHDTGDECLRRVAAVLSAEMRTPIDNVARYGGEEFCVVMPETGLEGALAVAERIRGVVGAMEFFAAGDRVPVTVSIGVAAVVPLDADYSREILRKADNMLYVAKAAGRNCVMPASR